MPHPNTNPDADAIYARISLSLAKSQRLFSSLPHDTTDPAPASTNPKSTNPNTTSNVDPDANSKPEPPLIPDSLPGLLGIGATPPSPTSGATDKPSSASDVLLRRQLLGKDWARKAGGKNQGQGGVGGVRGRGRDTIYPKPGKGRGGNMNMRVGARMGSEEVEEEEEEGEKGRSSLGGVRMKMKWGGGGVGGKEAGDEDGDRDGDEGAREARVKGVKRPGNYLDEVLAERVERRKKKRKKKKEGDKEGEDGSITN